MTFADFVASVPSASALERQAMSIAWNAAVEACARKLMDVPLECFGTLADDSHKECAFVGAIRIRRLNTEKP